jgi:hypothetical protein
MPYVNRGMLYGPAQAGLSFTFRGNTAPVDGISGDASLNAAVGLTSRLTLDGSLGTLSLEKTVRYRDPKLGLWFGLVDTTPVELDLTAGVTFGVPRDESVLHVFEPGAVAIFRLGSDARIDAAVYLPVRFEEGGKVAGIRAPAASPCRSAEEATRGSRRRSRGRACWRRGKAR